MKYSTIKRLGLGTLTLAVALFASASFAKLKIAGIYDITGGLNAYGVQQINGFKLAVESINANGGVLGKPIEMVVYDTQSELSKYTQYANTTVLRDRPAAVFAGLTSSSREAMRPIFRKANMPYFYSTLYEGGACDKQTFVTGPSASQQLEPLIKWAIKKYGPKIYIMAPDYNFGTISAHWIHEYAKKYGGEVVGEDFLALTVTDYAPTIQKVQQAKPDFVVSMPVGPNQGGFLEQFAAAGLKKNIGIVSTTYGNANENVVLSPAANKGVISSHAYFIGLDNPENKKFLELWTKNYGKPKSISPEAVTLWNAVHLWAAAVEKAGTAKPKAVFAELEKGELTFKGPNGVVSVEPGSHHVRHNIYLGKGNTDYGFDIIKTFESVAPSYENEVCNLVDNPKLAEHFTPDSKK